MNSLFLIVIVIIIINMITNNYTNNLIKKLPEKRQKEYQSLMMKLDMIAVGCGAVILVLMFLKLFVLKEAFNNGFINTIISPITVFMIFAIAIVIRIIQAKKFMKLYGKK